MTTVRRGTSGRHSRALRATAWALTLMALVSNGPSSRAQGDLTPPTVVARTPATGATGVSVQTTVSVVFSEPVQPATPVVELRNSSNQLIPRTAHLRRADADRQAHAQRRPGRQPDIHRDGAVGARSHRQHDDAGELVVQHGQRRVRRRDPAADRPGRSDGDRVRPRRTHVRRRKGRAHPRRTTTSTSTTGSGRRRPARQRLQLLGPRNVGHGAAPQLPGHALHLRPLRLRRRARWHGAALGLGVESAGRGSLSDTARADDQWLRGHRTADPARRRQRRCVAARSHRRSPARHRLVPAVPQPLDRVAGLRHRWRALCQRRRRRQLQLRRLRPDVLESQRQRRRREQRPDATRAAHSAARICGPAATT